MDISVSDAPVGRLIDGRYRVDSLLARGGMATVYKATDTRLDRTVALKVMHAELAADDAFVARFIAEARSAARLSDPHIVSVFDQGEDAGAVFLAMEFVQGKTLRDLLNERGHLDQDAALDVMESVLSALREAHAAEIVHRDVKPENVLISNDGRVKVADFGVARAPSGPNTTARGLLLGTVNYISPEQALGDGATARSDVYAAGIMLYEILTGGPPHTGPTDFVVVRAHIDEDVPPPSASVPVSPVVDDLVLTATARDASARYQDAGAFLAAVRLARAGLGSGTAPGAHGKHASRPAASPTPPPPPPPTPGEPGAGSAARGDPADHNAPHDDVDGHNPIELANAFYHETPPPRPAPQPPTARTRVIETQPDPAAASTATGDDASDSDGSRPGSGRRERQRRRRSWRGPVLFTVVLLLAALVTVAAWWFGAGRWTAAPALLNMEPEAAIAAAEEAGLNAEVDGEAYSESVEAGLVVKTEPGPGEQILRGGTVSLIISQGPERYEVPNLDQMSRSQAEEALSDRHLVGSFSQEHHNEIDEGHVISQDPEPGTEVRPDTEVSIVLSSGPEPIEVVDYTGRPGDEARAELDDAGFEVSVEEEHSDDVAAGIVISQEPDGGTAHAGDTVSLVVSRGPEVPHVEVPDVVDQRLNRARNELRQAGFQVAEERVEGESDDGGLPGVDWFRPARVRDQDPAGGTMAPQGSTVTIYVE